MDHWGYNMMPYSIFGFIFQIVGLVFLVLAILFVARYLMKNRKLRFWDNSMEILKERYAKGEIDKKEFEEKKKDLL